MRTMNFIATVMAAGLLAAAPAFAQSGTEQTPGTQQASPSRPSPNGANSAANNGYAQPAQQEGGRTFNPCSRPYNANPSGDPNCGQGAQNVMPSTNGTPR